jgi:hypothetical protein
LSCVSGREGTVDREQPGSGYGRDLPLSGRNNFIYGEITSDGYYGISQVKDGDLSILTGGGKLQPSDVILQDAQANQIQFLCAGNRFMLIVNDQFIDEIEAEPPASGDVGLIAGTFDKAGARVRFDDFSAALPPPGMEVGNMPSSGKVLLADDFSDPKSGWDVRKTENGASGYQDGQYFIRVDTPKFQLWSTPSESFKGDVRVEVTAGLAQGPAENEMGVICRYRTSKISCMVVWARMDTTLSSRSKVMRQPF